MIESRKIAKDRGEENDSQMKIEASSEDTEENSREILSDGAEMKKAVVLKKKRGLRTEF